MAELTFKQSKQPWSVCSRLLQLKHIIELKELALARRGNG